MRRDRDAALIVFGRVVVVRRRVGVELIDGRPSSSVGLLAYQEMLASQERITLRVVRDGVARDVVLTVRTLVE